MRIAEHKRRRICTGKSVFVSGFSIGVDANRPQLKASCLPYTIPSLSGYARRLSQFVHRIFQFLPMFLHRSVILIVFTAVSYRSSDKWILLRLEKPVCLPSCNQLVEADLSVLARLAMMFSSILGWRLDSKNGLFPICWAELRRRVSHAGAESCVIADKNSKVHPEKTTIATPTTHGRPRWTPQMWILVCIVFLLPSVCVHSESRSLDDQNIFQTLLWFHLLAFVWDCVQNFCPHTHTLIHIGARERIMNALIYTFFPPLYLIPRYRRSTMMSTDGKTIHRRHGANKSLEKCRTLCESLCLHRAQPEPSRLLRNRHIPFSNSKVHRR